ncbi:MAG TPA: elongation factor G, partial [Longimicrobiales bacterium]
MAAAREFRTESIRNLAVVGHGGSGKTTLIDALCFATGASRRHGSVKDGTALTMYTDEEVAHGISMQAAVAHAEWKDTKINLLDTPGYLDFTAEALGAVRVADGAVVVLGSTTGVEVGTEKVWEYCEARGLPRFFFVNEQDKEHADFGKVLQQVQATLSDKAVALVIPIGGGDSFRGTVNLLTGKAVLFKHGSPTGEVEETSVPEDMAADVETWRTQLLETIATTDDALLEAYLNEGSITDEQAEKALKAAVLRGDLFPVLVGASDKLWGVRALLDEIVELMPSPAEAKPELAKRPGLDQTVELKADDAGPVAVLVFKTTNEKNVGEVSYFRIFSGSLSNGQDVYNAGRETPEKLAHLSVPQGKERVEVDKLHAGDIGVVAKLKNTHTNDTLSPKDRPLALAPIAFPTADISIAIHAATRSDEDKIGVALAKLHEEDPTFSYEYDAEIKQTIVRGLGELHLDVQMERLKRKYGVEVITEQPRIRYRETIRKESEAQGKHKKQTGGHGQFGDCYVRLKPLPRGSGYKFTNAIVGGVIPGKFIPSVDKGVQAAAARGILSGHPVVDFEAECYFGSYHAVDSSDMAFQMAGIQAFRNASEKADPVILEPIIMVEIATPEDFVGDIIGDLNHRRGKVLGMEPTGHKTVIKALVPEAELYKYATTLRSISQGRASHTRAFHAFEEVPAQA